MKKLNILLLSIILIGCSGVNFKQWHIPYYIPIEQGVYISNEQLHQIHIGMTKSDVTLIINKPLTQFLFNQDRWDFIYQKYHNNALVKNYTVTLFFKQNIVYKIIINNIV